MPADGAGSSDSKGGGIRWQGWTDRTQADPQFLYKVCVEQIIGVGAAVLGDMSTRPNWGVHELDFVFSTLIVGSLMNFALMYLLAPTGRVSAASAKGIGALFDPKTLTNMGAPGGHIFEPGFSLKGRAINLVFKSGMFGFIGFCAGIVGTLMSNGLIQARCAMDPNFETQNETPNVLLNSCAWTLHMGVSSNIRYQMLNGLDAVMVSKLGPSVFKALVFVIRTANNLIGGVSFVTCARMVGSQKAKDPEPAPVVQAEEKVEKKVKQVVA